MPKEAVYGVEILEDVDDSEEEQPIVEVRWHRWPDSHVQVVTRRFGYEVCTDDPIPCEYGMYVTLDRGGINKLIRNLRRARDQAFGRDE